MYIYIYIYISIYLYIGTHAYIHTAASVFVFSVLAHFEKALRVGTVDKERMFILSSVVPESAT